MRQLPRMMGSVAMVLGLWAGGCQSEGGGMSQNEAPKPVAQDATEIVDTWGRLGYRLGWHSFATLTEAEGHVSLLDIDPEAILAMDNMGALTRLNPASGQHKWSTTVQSGYTQFFADVRIRDKVYSMSQSDIYVLDGDTGALRGRQQLDRVAGTRPVRFGDLIVYGTRNGQVVSHLASSGFMAWSYQLNGPIEVAPQAVGDTAVVAVSEAGDVIILDATTGASEGRAKMYAGSGSPPAVTADTIYVASKDQSVYAINTVGGAVRWRFRTDVPLTAQPVVFGANVHIDVPGVGLVAIDTKSGRRTWFAQGVTGNVINVRDGKLVVWNGREAVLLDAARGDVIERVALPGVQMLKADKLVDGSIYAVYAGGQISKFVVK
ncbi:MAG: PQQ-binding-like beta-propeller repeat protein [Phycisphaerales bacterium]